MVTFTCHPSNSRKFKIGRLRFRLTWAKTRPYLQNNQKKKGLELWLKQ
jgi:hypothetical protein